MAKMTLKVPKLAASMQQGTLSEWFVATGDRVSVGQKLYAIETEKTAFEVESPFEGVVTRIGELGVDYRIGTPVAEILT